MVGNQIKFILLKTPGDAYIEKNLTDEQILEGIFYIYGKEN
jgi:3-dehydroquinate synthase